MQMLRSTATSVHCSEFEGDTSVIWKRANYTLKVDASASTLAPMFPLEEVRRLPNFHHAPNSAMIIEAMADRF